MRNKSWGMFRLTRERRIGISGFLFILPWIIGFFTFFFIPMFQSFWYSFSTSGPLDEREGGIFEYLSSTFIGFENYSKVWTEDPNFTSNLVDSVTSFLYSLPIILIISLAIAIVLNQKFRGRMFARAIFFLPVIVASNVVMLYLNGDSNAQALLQSGQENAMYNSFSFSEMLTNLNLPESVITQLNTYISSIFTLIWSSGVQIILFLSGLQAISEQYYEVAKIEGSTSWETFWYVTFPMLTNVLILNVLYTCIDLFTDSSNKVMKQAYDWIERLEYNASAAIMWSYFLILAIIMALLVLISKKQIERNSIN